MAEPQPAAATSDATRSASKTPVARLIREGILRGDFVPGQRLVETDLSDQYSASRGAVRSALLELAADGLVERMANRGARVRVVPLEEAIEIYEVRQVMESLCARKAAENATAEDAHELRDTGQRMQDAVTAGDVNTYRELNERLHRRIREMSRQATAAGVLERLRAQIVRQQFRVASTPGRPLVSLPEHLAIIDAICRGHPDDAASAMHDHLSSVMDAMRRSHDRG